MKKISEIAAPQATVVLLRKNELFRGKVLLLEEGTLKHIPISGASYSAIVKLARGILGNHGIIPGSIGIYTYFTDASYNAHSELQSGKAAAPRPPLELKARIIQCNATSKSSWRYKGELINTVFMRFEGQSKARFKVAVLISQERSFAIRSIQFGPRPPEWLHELIVKAFSKSK